MRGYGDSPDPALLVPPPSEVRQANQAIVLEENWGEVLEAAETAMAEPCGRAWLDLQRYVVRAAEQCGYSTSPLLISEVRALLVDLPRLPQWELTDETPIANAETLAWLKQLESPAPPELPAPFSRNP